ncbi:hypothetical protein M201_gp51 [Haloarcula californiae tailed virus 2]|uniref:Uncharacterized protein n=1 Tax=Haloarcula californiae tailed virus 2 TaxID=1273747 RepID=R4TA57_9CAUD|nr:hypothetical protein M201_gp51 [Haloarcula californiae tailed virus 2]AGM11820.1 hypothetical protein HCTV2_50 [Haloarcula californiae tailed virus 2]
MCGACGERQVRLQRAEVDENGDTSHRAAVCQACGHQPSMQVFRENRLHDLLPEDDEWPDDSGAIWSENLPETPEGEDGAVLLVLGPREWDSLASRTSLTFRYEGTEVEVVKGRGPGVGFTFGDDGVGGVEVHLPSEALRTLHETGRWSASAGGTLDPVHVKVVVRADA